MNKRDEKRQSALIDRAQAVLDETNLPFFIVFPTLGIVRVTDMDKKFVAWVEGESLIYSNAEQRHAQAIIEDMSEILNTVRIKTIEHKIENHLDGEDWRDDEK